MSQLNLECLELREIRLPLKQAFETSFGRVSSRRVLIVRVVSREGAEGYGECVAMADPCFNAETIDTAWIIMANHLIPLLATDPPENAADVSRKFAPIRGNQMAKGALEAAIWDLEARLAGVPLWTHIGGERREIDCGVSIGIQPSIPALLEKVATELARGYQRIKIKIKPGSDVKLVEAVRSRYPHIRFSVDANSAYSLAQDWPVMQELDRHDLVMIEQPLRAGDLLDHAKLQSQLKTSICLDESITSAVDAQQALEMGSCRIINIKLGRVGGFTEAKGIEILARASGIPVWCGGMLETGIGRGHNIALSTLAGFTLPGDVSASERYWQEDIVDPPITVSAQGTITAPVSPGMGYQVNLQRLQSCTSRRQEISLSTLMQV
jgi:o-succinylbenzoate synthase